MKTARLFLVSLLFVLPALTAQEHRFQKTFALLPGQTVNPQNRDYHFVEIIADYPVQFRAGDCYNDSTVQWRCHFDQPADLFIRDLRAPAVFSQPKSNKVTVTVWNE